jgi:hypothetical protein
MAFGLVHTRISNYAPGDAYGVLKSLLETYIGTDLILSGSNMYCFNSETFRYLAAAKYGVLMDHYHEEDVSRSWGKSRDETLRLIETSKLRTPHHFQSTISLNRTRELVIELPNGTDYTGYFQEDQDFQGLDWRS